MIHKTSTLLFIGILSVAIFTRFWNLSSNPVQLNRDEAALAYNALLLSKTGNDEWQEPYSFTLKSFGDYKLVGYPTVLMALFSVLPQSDWVVRLPSAFAGVGIVFLLYIFGKRIGGERTGLAISGLAAITPVLIFYSRTAYEANLALFVLFAGLLLSFNSARSWKQLLAGVVLLLISQTIYNTPLLLMPMILVSLLIFYNRVLFKEKRVLVLMLAYLLGTALIFNAVYQATSQKSAITIFSDPTILNNYPNYRAQFETFLQPVLGNKYTYFAFLALQRFVMSFTPEFLVYTVNAHPWHSVPEYGHITLFTFLLFWSGVGYSVVRISKVLGSSKRSLLKILNKAGISLTLFFGLIVSLLPSIITVDAPHATRSLLFFVIIIIFAGWVLPKLFYSIQKRYTPVGAWLIIVSFLCILVFQSFQYYLTYMTTYREQQLVLYKGQLATALSEKLSPEDKVWVVDPEGYDYIVFAWYDKIQPEEFHTSIVHQAADIAGLHYGEGVGRFTFVRNPEDAPDQVTLMQYNKQSMEWVVTK